VQEQNLQQEAYECTMYQELADAAAHTEQ